MKIDEIDVTKSPLQNVKQRFFALRNGLLADMLRKSGSPYRIIFGLNLPQIREVAAAFGTDTELSETLWANVTTRESRLVAPMLADRTTFTIEDARRWCRTLSGSPEEVDVLCWALLRHLHGIDALVDEMVDCEEDIRRYTAMRLAANLLRTDPKRFKSIALNEINRNCPLTKSLALQIVDEADFLDA